MGIDSSCSNCYKNTDSSASYHSSAGSSETTQEAYKPGFLSEDSGDGFYSLNNAENADNMYASSDKTDDQGYKVGISEEESEEKKEKDEMFAEEQKTQEKLDGFKTPFENKQKQSGEKLDSIIMFEENKSKDKPKKPMDKNAKPKKKNFSQTKWWDFM
jgi:hypothetical protein